MALIGPNGAGKTTLMDCLLGDKFLTAGEAQIQGLKPTDNHLKQSVSDFATRKYSGGGFEGQGTFDFLPSNLSK